MARSKVDKIISKLRFFLILKHESVIFPNCSGSSVINNTRSRLTLANNKISLNNKVQYGFTERPSTRDKSPPKIHWRPGAASINGLQRVNTRRDSKSCNVSKGRPSPNGSIKPPPTVISRYAAYFN